MPTRRAFTFLTATLAPMLARPGFAQTAAPPQAVAFIRDAGTRLGRLSVGATSPAERHARLVAFLDEVVDIDGVARFCLGRFWRLATPPQQTAYLAAFREVLIRNVGSRVDGYTEGSATIAIGQPTGQGDAIQVPTQVERAGSPPLRVTWVVRMEDGHPRIVDLIAEGVSLRVTQRSDYASFIEHNHNDVGALIAALQRQQALPDPSR